MKMLSDLNRRAVARMRALYRVAASEGAGANARHADGRLRRGEEGQALIEFAFVLPMMFMLLTGIFMFSIAMYSKISLQTATDQGVQALALCQNVCSTNPCTAATTAINTSTVLNPSLIGITFLNGPPATGTAISGGTCANLPSGTVVTVKTTYPCSLAIYNFMRSCQLGASESEAVP
jgi:Flp pilus assembly protein TadG